MEKEKPNFYANIPAYVRYDKDLCANAKLLYGEITALCNKEGYCWSSNDYFSECYGVTIKSVSRWITELENKGYIKRQMIYKEDSKEVKQRRLYLSEAHRQNCLEVGTKLSRGMDKNVQDNNTINNTINNKDIKTIAQQVEQELQNQFEEFYSIYPKKVNRKKAEQKFKLKVKKHGIEKVMQGAYSYIHVMQLNNTEKQYIKGPDVFLNGEHYLDDHSQLLKENRNKPFNPFNPWEVKYGRESNQTNIFDNSSSLPTTNKTIGFKSIL